MIFVPVGEDTDQGIMFWSVGTPTRDYVLVGGDTNQGIVFWLVGTPTRAYDNVISVALYPVSRIRVIPGCHSHPPG